MVRYKDGALRGSGQAAFVIAEHYFRAGDMKSAEYWYRIGAQNGNAGCMYAFGSMLVEKQNRLDQERGRYWLARASKAGMDG
jgi:TPR repeat protein